MAQRVVVLTKFKFIPSLNHVCFFVIQELLMAEKWARKNNLKFPPINAKEQYQKDDLKEYYVFAHPTDPTCPVVVHFVLVNKTFKEESYPGLFEDLSNF